MGDREVSLEQAGWPSFLRGDDASHIHARMGNGDPLRLRERSARRLREVWYLLDPDRLFARAVAACAESAAHDEPPPDLDAWALEMIDRAVDQLVHADREAEHTKHSTPTDEEKDFPLLTESLMLEPEDVRRVSVAFNALDALPRRAFFELMIEGREPPPGYGSSRPRQARVRCSPRYRRRSSPDSRPQA
jgi:hypothetical protein